MNKLSFRKKGINLIFLTSIAAVMLLIIGLLVTDAVASSITTQSNSILLNGQGSNLLSHGGTFDGCLVEQYNAAKPASETSLNCTANDVGLAQYNLLSGPTSCIEGEDITITLMGEFVSTASERYDVGVFIATDGGDPNSLGGSCYNDFLHPVSANNSDLDLSRGLGPFYNGEIAEDPEYPADLCGDILQGENAFFQTAQITIKCQDSNDDGNADVNTCTVWANSRSDGTVGKPSCTSEMDTFAQTSSKCNCDNVEIAGLSVPLDGSIEVIKAVDPVDAPGAFNLQIDGDTEFADAGNGNTTGPVAVSAGFSTDPDPIRDTHTVGETAGTVTDLSLYVTEILCADGEGDTASGTDAGPLDVFVEPDDAWVCTITNTYSVIETEPPATEPPATEPPATEPPTTEPPATTAPPEDVTPTEPVRTPTPPPTLGQPTSPAETPEILIPETGLDLSLSNQTSDFNFWVVLFLGLGFVGTGMVFHGITNRLKRNQTKK